MNSAIERERHPIPTIEEVLYDLNGSTVFSKLDLKWGFRQVELDEKSRKITTFVTHRGLYRSREITTFVTHRGLYRYKRLMSGVTSAPEKYQKIVAYVLHGCEGVANLADDLIVHGCGIKEFACCTDPIERERTNLEWGQMSVSSSQAYILRS